jgi:hypothetical protein
VPRRRLVVLVVREFERQQVACVDEDRVHRS